jgi:hypothetical protein
MQRHKPEKRTGIAHPYIRISEPDQRKGGGLERQRNNDLAAFADQFGFALSKRIRVDDGVSAWKGLHLTPGHELGQFLLEAKRGLIRPGDCLLIENYDRISRQDVWAAIGLVRDLRELGIHVGRLDRMKLLRADSTDMGDFFEAAVEFGRGNSESNMKSFRNGKKWEERRKAAREKKGLLTRRVPAWIQVVDGKMALRPGPAASIKRAFELLASGYGVSLTVAKLREEGLESFGRSARWTRSYLSLLAKDRRADRRATTAQERRNPGRPTDQGLLSSRSRRHGVLQRPWSGAAEAGEKGKGYTSRRVVHRPVEERPRRRVLLHRHAQQERLAAASVAQHKPGRGTRPRGVVPPRRV